MRLIHLICLTLLSNLTFSQTTATDKTTVAPEVIVGEWIIDLRTSPEASPYLQSFIVSQQDGNKFTGLFYGSPIQETCLNKNWNKLHFAFRSSDTNHDYYQTGYIVGDEIFGVSYCPQRDFVMPWSGKKIQK